MGAAPSAQALERSSIPAVWARYTDIVVDRGEGSWLLTREGERYLDFSSGIAVTSTGHSHPRVAAAISTQAGLIHGQQNVVSHEPGIELHARLAKLLPGGPWQAFLATTGAEAVEAAVKLARMATGRPGIVAFRGGFHGRTEQTMALSTSRVQVRRPDPLPSAVFHTPGRHVVRIVPPLVVTEAEVTRGLEIIERALGAVTA